MLKFSVESWIKCDKAGVVRKRPRIFKDFDRAVRCAERIARELEREATLCQRSCVELWQGDADDSWKSSAKRLREWYMGRRMWIPDSERTEVIEA